MHTSAVGNSISAHPLLPLADSNLSAEASKLSASLGSMGAAVATEGRGGRGHPASPTTRSASRPLGTAISWSSVPDTTSIKANIMVPRPPAVVPTTNSPSPTETQSASDASSATVSPLASPDHKRTLTSAATANRKPASPLAVRAAVHRADTGIITHTHITSRTPSSHKSEGSLLDQTPQTQPAFSNNYVPSQTQSQNDLGPSPRPQSPMEYSAYEPPPKRKLWQRSASCRDLYDFSFEETGKAKRRAKSPRLLEKTVVSLDERKQDSPVTVYDDHRALYSASSRDSSLEIQQDIMVPKIYSSSFPGTKSFSQESVEDPGNYDLRDSQDDLSHDSYELIEKSDDSTEDYKKPKPINARSCSLDSGNYLPSDSEEEHGTGRQKYKSDHDIFLMEDPRDLPREIIPRKSDGNFYKQFKQSSRTSSLESKSDYYESKNSSLKKSSRTSSQESKSDYETISRKSLKKNKSADDSRRSSIESKSEYFDAPSDQAKYKKVDYDRKINFERNYGTHIRPEPVLPAYPDFETEQSLRVDKLLNDIEQNTLVKAEKTTHIWPEAIAGLPTEILNENISGQRSTESESNIFSFDEDRIQSLQESSDFSDHGFSVVPNIDLKANKKEHKNYKDIFMEIEPRICHDLPLHQPIERTKSDPNSLARQRSNPHSRRLLLMHQKSIDLTPAESSDDDYLYKQIPSAPPIIAKFKGTHFEMPTAEFGHFDILKREIEGQKTKFEVPKSQFEVLGAKNQADLMNLPPKSQEDIPYVLHKRHITTQKEAKEENVINPKPETSFLFTQNIDLSKVNPVTLEVDKTVPPIQLISSPKRDITHIDPLVLETLNSKLSQIESDSPTSSRTESLKPIQRIITPLVKNEQKTTIEEKVTTVNIIKPEVKKPEPKPQIKTDIIKPKRIIKPRMQPGKKGCKSNKTKVRITSFSSDDESLDSDDVFGSAEATPTRIEFSPPQMRKEMESILKFESERKYLQYTMSSTEVEGSPPTTRKKTTDRNNENGLDPQQQTQTELRRISERSFSIPSSEDEFNIKTIDLAQSVFAEPDLLKTVVEDGDETLKDDNATDNDLTIDDEREREKALLAAEIEEDLRNLKVPAKTKITEIMSPSLRNKSPLLFAHARLNLSEGSAFSLLQKQQALDSPLANRRARSLDAPIIPVNKLPPLNAFSSKDDTVEEEDHKFTTSTEASDVDDIIKSNGNGIVPEKPPILSDISKESSLGENDQIVPDVTSFKRKTAPKLRPKLPPKGVVPPKPMIGKKPLKEKPKLVKQNPSSKPPIKPKTPDPKSVPKAPKPARLSIEKVEIESKSDSDDQKIQSLLTLPEIKRTKSQELELNKKSVPKTEKARSLEKIELKRMSSKERTKSQEESDEVIAERRKLQQMLYETAIKQTKTLKSPVKDVLPVFPQVEETVRERGGKLEISINTIEPSVSLEEAIIVTKSPKKLDKKLDKKLTKSLELNLNDVYPEKGMQRLGKSLDLERSKSEDEADKSTEFDFKPETIKNIYDKDTSPEVHAIQETITADIHHTEAEQVILEGTSLDVWLSVANKKTIKDIQIIHEGGDFFEQPLAKAPDLSKASSSDSASIEKISLGNSLDIKYIDESTGESSGKSDKDKELIAEMLRASATVSKFIKKKLEKRRKDSDDETTIVPEQVKTFSEDESLTEVSEIRQEKHLLTVTVTDHQDALLKLGVQRSKSEDTGSWMTVECDEFIGTESSLDYDQESPLDKDLLNTDMKHHGKLKLLKRSSDQSRSSDTGSWTSGEKELSPSNIKETDESSVSCSMGRAIGLSQNIEMFATKEQFDDEPPKSPRSPRSPRISVLGRAFTIDEGSQKLDESSSDEANDIPKDLAIIEEKSTDSDNGGFIKAPKKYPFEEKWSQDSELSQKLHKKLSKKLSSNESDLKLKPNLINLDKLSTESKNSLDTESSSGSLGITTRAHKSGDIPKELSSTWKPFPLDSSGSESFEDFLPPDQDLDKHEYFMCRDNGSGDFTSMADVYTPTRDDTELPEDLANFPANFGYPLISTDILGSYSQGGFLSRTLSRISERSTNSEKSSLEEDSTKASTQSDSLNDEATNSSNPQVSISSESPSHAHVYDEKKTPTNEKPLKQEPTPNFSSLLQRQISDDRRTSAEMAELSMDDIEIITSERGLRLKRQGSDDTIIDEEFEDRLEKQSSQEEDWPLPEIPSQNQKLIAMHEVPSSDTSAQLTTQVYQPPIPKTFGLRGSLKSQDSEQWPSPPSSIQEPIVENIETYYISPAEEACRVTVENIYDDSNSDDYKSVAHTYENIVNIDHVSESLSDQSQSQSSVGPSGIKIILEEKSHESNSDEDLNISNLNDDVFIDATTEQLRPPTALRRSTASDDSRGSRKSSHSSYSEEDCTSSMGTNLEDGTVRFALKPTKCTHSSHSEDTSIALSLSEWSNSTNTVKFQNLSTSNSGTKSSTSGLKSDENSLTDIAQSISEWSTSSTLKVQQPFQKLSSTTSTGEASTLTELIPSITEWSNSDAKPLVPQFPTRLGSSVDIDDIIQDQRSPKNIPSEDFSLFSSSTSKFFTKSTERPIIIPPLQSDTDSSIEHKTVHTQRYDKDKKGYLQKSTDRPVKVNLKLAKCSPYYSSSLSSESTPLQGSSPIPINKTATVPLTRVHKRPVSRILTHAKSPPSENDSTSSVESPKSKSERERRGYRRKKQMQQQRNKKNDKCTDEYYYVEHEHGLTEYNEYIRERNMEEMASNFQYEAGLAQDSPHYENLEEGYYPDGDSQSGSDIFRMEREEEDKQHATEGFDVSSIPPPLLEDDDNNFDCAPTTHI
ncbi:unnamed protein product [Ceutorhynchus assimilis]|uniref:Uncharacterized protein n=1 Tax=Ceutorhynchus assimilis TaxID=467358 RepID=A0A9N9MV05_9CUCU|nr:unnamed protein product [Ceutorhynchus assimilis]